MRHVIHQPSPTGKYKAALLIKEPSLSKHALEHYYINHLVDGGYNSHDIISFSLDYNEQGKAPAKLMNSCISALLKVLDNREVKTLFVADAPYFKKLTKQTKADIHIGYVLPCAIKNYEHINVILSINYGALFHNPDLKDKINISLATMLDTMTGIHIEPGADIIHNHFTPYSPIYINEQLEQLHKYPVLTVDVETFSLEIAKGMLGTIAFAWDEHNGTTIDVAMRGNFKHTQSVLVALRDFFVRYTGKCIYHGATFDIKVLILELYMKDLNDKKGLIYGLKIMTRNIECTKLITFLATNSTSGNKLDLKSNAQEFAGNYAVEAINDITQIPIEDLYKYNLIDCLATWYVFNKNTTIMFRDKQVETYRTVLLPSVKVVVQMELTGMPVYIPAVLKVETKLSEILWMAQDALHSSAIIIHYEKYMRMKALILKNSKLKKKVVYERDFIDEEFNPASNNQVSSLLHDFLKLPVIDTTPTKQASVGAKTLKKHLNQLKSKFNITEEDLK